MKYTEFMSLVVSYANAKHNFLVERSSGKCNIRKESKLRQRMEDIYDRLCTEAARAFPGGAEYEKTTIDELKEAIKALSDCAEVVFKKTYRGK